jgi:hypothetical protein
MVWLIKALPPSQGALPTRRAFHHLILPDDPPKRA